MLASLYIAGSTTGMIAQANIATTTHEVGLATTTESTILSPKHIEQYVRNEYKNEPILVEVARCESTFRQFDAKGNIVRGKVNDNDVGVMQINEKYHADTAVKLGLNIYTVEGNVAYAKILYKKFGTQPWSSSQSCWAGNTLAKI